MQPTRSQLENAAAAAAEIYGAEQVILFGSRARGDARPGSDIDLLVLTGPDGSPPDPRQWGIEELDEDSRIGRLAGGRPVHVVLMTRANAEAARSRPGRVGASALEDGITVYTDKLHEPVKTGPEYWLTRDGKMVKKTLFDPEDWKDFSQNAEWFLTHALNPPDQPPNMKCVQLQHAAEHALKGLLTAAGRRIPHKHDLNALWTTTEEAGIRIDAPRDEDALEELSKYGGDLQYGGTYRGKNPAGTFERTAEAGQAIVKLLRERGPAIAEETAERLRELERNAAATIGPGDDAPPSGTGGPASGAAAV